VPSIRYGWEDDHVSFALVTETRDPKSYREAIEVDNSDKWITVIVYKIKSLDRNQT